MRERFLREFDALWFDSLNGDSRETGKLTPDGKPDPSIFSTDFNREGIRIGTTVGLLVRRGERAAAPTVAFRQYWGANKRADLLASLRDPDLASRYERATPTRANRYSFRPSHVAVHYRAWPRLNELAQEASNGLMEKRGGALIAFDKEQLAQRMRLYYDRNVSWDDLAALDTGLTEDAARFDARKARAKVQAAEPFRPEQLRRYAVRPFDTRWCYYSRVSPLWNRSRPTLQEQCWEGNEFVLSRMKGTASPEGIPMYAVSGLSDDHLLMADAVCFPIRLRRSTTAQVNAVTAQPDLFSLDAPTPRERTIANLSAPARAYLATLGAPDPDADAATLRLLWMHALAIGFAPAYRADHADGIREDWPRIPLPASLDLLAQSAALGAQLAALLDTERPVAGVTAGAPDAALARLGALTVADASPLDLAHGDLDVTAGWGHAGRDGVTMPGRGKLTERPYSAEELAAFDAAGVGGEQGRRCLGAQTCDIYATSI